jgi:hypothetical protein
MLDDQALMSVLGLVQGRRDVGRVLLVCRGWSKLLQGDAGFKAKAQQHMPLSIRINSTISSHSPDYAYYIERRAYRYGYNSDSSGYGSC